MVRSRCDCFFTNDFCPMSPSDPQRQAQLRALIQTFLTERLDGKLEALTPDDPKRPELQAQFVWRAWIDDAARRSAQIQCATHTLKPISLYTTPLSHKLPRELDACGEVDDALHTQPDGFDTRLPVPLTRQKASQAGH